MFLQACAIFRLSYFCSCLLNAPLSRFLLQIVRYILYNFIKWFRLCHYSYLSVCIYVLWMCICFTYFDTFSLPYVLVLRCSVRRPTSFARSIHICMMSLPFYSGLYWISSRRSWGPSVPSLGFAARRLLTGIPVRVTVSPVSVQLEVHVATLLATG
jgi:hypothetical protein